jgi:hypothetical protein
MLRTLEAVIESDGEVRLLEPVTLSGPCRALITLLDESGNETLPGDTALSDWLREEEDTAWAHLQQAQ